MSQQGGKVGITPSLPIFPIFGEEGLQASRGPSSPGGPTCEAAPHDPASNLVRFSRDKPRCKPRDEQPTATYVAEMSGRGLCAPRRAHTPPRREQALGDSLMLATFASGGTTFVVRCDI